jgi:hypothetical protein
MQSGSRNTREWVMQFEPGRNVIDPLMGWVGSDDTRNQLRLKFGTVAEAIAFAERKGLAYTVLEPRRHVIQPKSYADNFRD